MLEELEARSREAGSADGNRHARAAESRERIDGGRAELVTRLIAELVEANLLRPSFSVLHVESGDGEVLSTISSAFPGAECYGVEWPQEELGAGGSGNGADSGIHTYRIDIAELFQSRPDSKRERFDVVIMSGRFEPAGAPPLFAKQADAWLEKQTRYVIGVAAPDRVEELLERGMSVQFLEAPGDDGDGLICWSNSVALPGADGTRGGQSFARWFRQNLQRHGLRDALYYAGHVVLAVLDGRLPLPALGDQKLRTRFCATLTPRRHVRPNTVYVFAFLGEFGFEVLNWQGIVRKFAAGLPASSKIVIAGRRGLEPFYEGAAQYVEIDDIPEYRDSYAAAYFAMAPDEFRRYRPPTNRQFGYDRRLRKIVEKHVRDALRVKGRRVEFVFSTELNAIGDCVFGADPRFYGMSGYGGSIYARLDLANNTYARIRGDEAARPALEAKLGFSLDEPYVLVQGRSRTIGPQWGRDLDTDPLLAELGRDHRVVYLGFRSGRYLDSGSSEAGGAVTFYEADSFREQSCLIAHASLCVFATEGDLGSHTYLPPLLGRNVAVFASREVFDSRTAPVEFWNRNVFRFGGQMIPWVAEELDSAGKIRAALEELARTPDGASEVPPTVPAATKRILFVMRHEGYVRNCEYVVEQLAERGHSVHIAITASSRKPHDAEVLPQLTSRWPSITSGRLPRLSIRAWDDATGVARVVVDYLRYLRPEYDAAPQLRARMTRRVPRPFLRLFPGVPGPAGRLALAAANAILRRVDRVAPAHLEADEYLLEMRPDLVVFTPLLEAGSAALDYLKSAQALGVPTVLCVASWDNLSSKGLIQIVPDRVIVWNDVQKDEAVRMHGVSPDRVVVTGAHLFDHWFEMQPSCSREEFCERRGLDPAEPFLLYVCSSAFVTGNEIPFVRRWIDTIRAADSPLARAGILVRPHSANDPVQWSNAQDLTELPNVSVWPPLGEGPTDDRSKQNYFDSLFHCAGVVGINTSALIEGGIVGKHVFTILADEFRETQAGTVHFNYLVEGGLLAAAPSLEEHVEQLDRVLVRGDSGRDEARDAFIGSFVRPHGLEVSSSPLAVRALEELVEGRPATRGAGTPVVVGLARVLARPLATIAHLHVRRKRTQAMSVREARQGTGAINLERALPTWGQDDDGAMPEDRREAKIEALAEKREAAIAAKQEVMAAKREAMAEQREAELAARREAAAARREAALAAKQQAIVAKREAALARKQEALAAREEAMAPQRAAELAAKQEAAAAKQEAARAAKQEAIAAKRDAARAAKRERNRQLALDEGASGPPADGPRTKEEGLTAKQEALRAAREEAIAAKRDAARAAKRERSQQLTPGGEQSAGTPSDRSRAKEEALAAKRDAARAAKQEAKAGKRKKKPGDLGEAA